MNISVLAIVLFFILFLIQTIFLIYFLAKKQKNDESSKNIESIIKNEIDRLRNDQLQTQQRERFERTNVFNALQESVDEKLLTLQKGLGEIAAMTHDVDTLKKVLSNVKTKGVLGEVQLEALLEDILTPSQYEKNVKTNHKSDALVEFAIVLPSKTGKKLYVPLDAKFPTKDYERLIEAYEKGSVEQVISFRKELVKKIRSFAKDISQKYIDPPFTTDFAIMFLPFEGLYSEILRIPGLFQRLQSEYRVTITGPVTISAFLNSLQLGFQTLAVEKRTSDVWQLLSEILSTFHEFSEILSTTEKKIDTASIQISKALRKTHTIEKKLKKVSELSPDSLP